MNSNITNFFQVRVQKFLFFEFEFGQNCRVLRVRVRSPGIHSKLHVDKTAPLKVKIDVEKNLKNSKNRLLKPASDSLCAIGGNKIISFCYIF